MHTNLLLFPLFFTTLTRAQHDCAIIADGGGAIGKDKEARCSDLDNLYPESVNEFVVDKTEAVAGTRCCEDSTDSNGNNVVTHTNVCQNNKGCDVVTWQQAHNSCSAQGKRLCTRKEVLEGPALKTCRYKFMHTWTSDTTACPTPPDCVLVVDGGKKDKASKCGVYAALTGFDESSTDQIASKTDPSALAGVRCCDAQGKMHDQCYYACEALTYASAEFICAQKNMQLCDAQTLVQKLGSSLDLASGSNCNYQYMFVWSKTTSNQCGNGGGSCNGGFQPVTLPNNNEAVYMVDVKSKSIVATLDLSSPAVADVFFLSQMSVNTAEDLTFVANIPGATTVEFTLENPIVENVSMANWPNEKKQALYVPDCNLLSGKCKLVDGVSRDAADGFSLNGVSGCDYVGGGEFKTGLGKGWYRLTAVGKNGQQTVSTLKKEVRIYESTNMNPAPPVKSGDRLDVAPYAIMPYYNWNDRPFPKEKLLGRPTSPESYRVNNIVPWGNYVYFVMELACVVYKVSGLVSAEERTQQIEAQGENNPWFDVYKAVWDQTGVAGNGPQRNMDTSSELHSGLRTIAFHPDFTYDSTGKGTGYVYVAILEERPGLTVDKKTGERYCPWDSEVMEDYNIVNAWKDGYIGDFEEGWDEHNYACGESVVVEFYFDKDQLTQSYRQLVRMTYTQTGLPADKREFEHPIKKIAFKPETTELYIESGDGSVDSTTVFGGQSDNVYGKILRIDVQGGGGNHFQKAIPGDNYRAVHSGSKMHETVCAVGFRNPHSLSFFKKGPYKKKGIMFDGGRDNVEEVNILDDCSDNYGWSNREGIFTQFDWVAGVWDGIAPLPPNDADFGYRYPAAFFGHDGEPSSSFDGQCGVGAFPIENDSELNDYFFFVDFPKTGYMYYSKVPDMMSAKQKGKPDKLTQATVYRSKFREYEKASDYFDPSKQSKANYDDFRRLAIELYAERFAATDPFSDKEKKKPTRVDARFGEGAQGELLLISKTFGVVYTVLNSLPPGFQYTS